MKTAGFHAAKGMPGAISIARRAPKGFEGIPMYRALAPGGWFMSVSKEVYFERFCNEILGKLDAEEVWNDLHILVNTHDEAMRVEPILCCWERAPLTDANWCHRTIVADWFELMLGPDYRIGELEPCKHKRPKG